MKTFTTLSLIVAMTVTSAGLLAFRSAGATAQTATIAAPAALFRLPTIVVRPDPITQEISANIPKLAPIVVYASSRGLTNPGAGFSVSVVSKD